MTQALLKDAAQEAAGSSSAPITTLPLILAALPAAAPGLVCAGRFGFVGDTADGTAEESRVVCRVHASMGCAGYVAARLEQHLPLATLRYLVQLSVLLL